MHVQSGHSILSYRIFNYYHISANSFLPWIVSALLCRSQYIRPNSKKNSFRGNYSRKYGICDHWSSFWRCNRCHQRIIFRFIPNLSLNICSKCLAWYIRLKNLRFEVERLTVFFLVFWWVHFATQHLVYPTALQFCLPKVNSQQSKHKISYNFQPPYFQF